MSSNYFARINGNSFGNTGTGLDQLVAHVNTDFGLSGRISDQDISQGGNAADQMNAILIEAINETGVTSEGDSTFTTDDVRVLNQYIRTHYLEAWGVLHGDDEGNYEETGFHLVQNDGASEYFRGKNLINTVADGIYHMGFEIVGDNILNEDGDPNATLDQLAEWLTVFYTDHSTTDTGLDRMVDMILADKNLSIKISQDDIEEGADNANAMNHIITKAIDETGVSSDGDISESDIRDINTYIRSNFSQELWIQLHGDDEKNGDETGFHLVQNDGAGTGMFGKNFVNTVADGIYHLGFEIDGDTILNEDGNQNASVSDLADWVQYFYVDQSSTGTKLDTLVDAIKSDRGLSCRTNAGDINQGAGAANKMNHILVNAIQLTDVADDNNINIQDIRTINNYIRENNLQQWTDLHGDDEDDGSETGFHLVQNDGGNIKYHNQKLINTVADGIYHLGFEIQGNNILNEDGDENAALSDLATWLNDFYLDKSIIYGSDQADYLKGMNQEDEFHAGAGDDKIYAYGGDDIVYGDGGNDRLYGHQGNDTLIGGSGNDKAYGGDGNDTLIGGLGDDYLVGDGGDDILEGGVGHDKLIGGSGIDKLTGGEGNDTLYGKEGNDDLDGGIGNDYFSGGDGVDMIQAGDGNDKAYGGDGNDTLIGGLGDDYLVGDGGDDILEGGVGHDKLIGGSGIDKLTGGEGNDTLYGKEGNDDLDGGIGNDYFSGGDGVDMIQAGDGNDKAYGGDGNDILIGGLGDDYLVGDGGDDILEGGVGHDKLIGGSGIDKLTGGEGNDTLYGKEGNDDLDGGIGNDYFSGGDGVDMIQAGDGNDKAYGGDGNDTLIGGLGDDYLVGDGGDDILEGGVGHDKLIGGSGIDKLTGGEGNDTLYGKEGNDDLDGGIGNDYFSGGDGVDMIQAGDGNDKAYGGDGNDTLIGGLGDDYLVGDGGDDILEGGLGHDKLIGGSGNDVLIGGNGDDTLYGQDGADYLMGNNGNDYLKGYDGNDILYGGAGDDKLCGYDDDDVMISWLGSDTLYGGSGDDVLFSIFDDANDELRGEKGADTFVFTRLNTNNILGEDIIKYFSASEGDKIIIAGEDIIATLDDSEGKANSCSNVSLISLTTSENEYLGNITVYGEDVTQNDFEVLLTGVNVFDMYDVPVV